MKVLRSWSICMQEETAEPVGCKTNQLESDPNCFPNFFPLKYKKCTWAVIKISVIGFGVALNALAACEAELDAFGANSERFQRASGSTATAELVKQRFMDQPGKWVLATKEAKQFSDWEIQFEERSKNANERLLPGRGDEKERLGARSVLAEITLMRCLLGVARGNIPRGTDSAPRLANDRSLNPLQAETQQAQQRVRENQARADQDAQRKGKRSHDPAAEAHQCIQPNFGGLYGGMKNVCNYKVWFTFCGYKPNENSWLKGAMQCERQGFGTDSVSPGRESATHTKGVQTLYWFACKDPAWPLDQTFVEGQGISGRCRAVGSN